MSLALPNTRTKPNRRNPRPRPAVALALAQARIARNRARLALRRNPAAALLRLAVLLVGLGSLLNAVLLVTAFVFRGADAATAPAALATLLAATAAGGFVGGASLALQASSSPATCPTCDRCRSPSSSPTASSSAAPCSAPA